MMMIHGHENCLEGLDCLKQQFRNLLLTNRSIDDQTIKDFRVKSSGINKDGDSDEVVEVDDDNNDDRMMMMMMMMMIG